jgi:hypothetical protein
MKEDLRMKTLKLAALAMAVFLLAMAPELGAIGLDDLPGDQTQTVYLPTHAAATATENYPIFSAPFDCTIQSVIITPALAVTGVDTNYTNINLINRGTAGTTTTELANYDLELGNDLAIMDEYSLYAPATALSVSDGNVLAIQFEKVGTGLLVPALIVQTTYRAR